VLLTGEKNVFPIESSANYTKRNRMSVLNSFPSSRVQSQRVCTVSAMLGYWFYMAQSTLFSFTTSLQLLQFVLIQQSSTGLYNDTDEASTSKQEFMESARSSQFWG
jgi:hypothetical protein